LSRRRISLICRGALVVVVAMPVTELLVLATPMLGVGMSVVAAGVKFSCRLCAQVLLRAHRVFR
jgi:hypothetical protein